MNIEFTGSIIAKYDSPEFEKLARMYQNSETFNLTFFSEEIEVKIVAAEFSAVANKISGKFVIRSLVKRNTTVS